MDSREAKKAIRKGIDRKIPRVENNLYKGINIGGINRADVADFLIKQAENQTEVIQYIGLSEK